MSTLSSAPPAWRVAICTWFGAGLLRPAPGTWGSLAAALLAAAILVTLGADLGRLSLVVGVVLVSLAGVVCAPAAMQHFGVEDPPQVVVDEVAGTWLAILILPSQVLTGPLAILTAVGVALLLFRVFDIAKPWPITSCEHLPGGWGIMADDLVAGLFAGVLATALLG